MALAGPQSQLKTARDSNLKVTKILSHPGEINSFKCWTANRRILASHSDEIQDLYIWDVNT